MAEGVLANLEKEYRALLAPKLLAEAKAVQVVWARVKGYPAWPAQVLTEAAALRRKDLGQERHSKGNSVPVMFFGTVEVAWVKDADVVDFKEGLHQGFFDRKTKPFKLALEQVCEYLALDRKRKAPPKWWCKPPSNGLDEQADGQASRPASVSGSGAAKGAVQRQDASKSSRQRTTTDGSSSSASSDEDGGPAEQTGIKKGAGKLQQPTPAAPVCKPRDSSSARPPRDNGSTAASTNTSAQGKKRLPAPQPASSRPQAGGTDAAKAGRVLPGTTEPVKGGRDGRSAAAATNSASNMPPPALGPQQHLKGAHPVPGVPVGLAKDNIAGLPPRKRLKVESAQDAGAIAGTANSLPRPPAPKELIGHTEGCGLGPLGDVAVNDVLKLPAEIRRLAGIRLPAVPKKTGAKVEQSPREHASVKEEVALAATTPAANTSALQVKQEDGMEMRVLRSGRGRADDARPGQPLQGVSSQGKRSRRSPSSSDEDSPSITSSDADDAEEEGQSSGEEADTEADESSSDDSDGSSDVDTSVVTTRKGGQRTSTGKARSRIAPHKDPAQRPRDRKGEKQRRLARFAAPEPANRRTSLRLLPKLVDKATPGPEKGSCGQSSSEGSGDEDDDRDESSREDSGSGTSSGGEGAREAKASDDGGSLKLCSRSRSRNGTRSEGQRQGEEATTGKAPSSREPSLSVGAGVKTRSARGEAVTDGELVDGGKSQPRDHSARCSTGIPPAPLPLKAVPLELRRLQDSSSGAPPVVDMAEPRVLRDRSSPARRAAGSLGTTPTQTVVTAAVPGKVVHRGPSEEGSGVSMSTAAKRDGAVEPSRYPDQRAEGEVATETKEAIKRDSEPALDSRHSKASLTTGSLIPSAPVASGVPVRKKPPSLGIPNTARPALLPARPMPRGASSGKRDTASPSTIPIVANLGALAAGAVAPAAVCVHRKPSTGPPTRRVLGPVADTPVSSLDISDMAIVDCEADAKHASSPDVPPATTATGDGQLPRSPGAASDGAGRDSSTGPVAALQSHVTSQLQRGVTRPPQRADQQEQERTIDSLQHMEQVIEQALAPPHALCRGQPKAEAQAVVAETGGQEVRNAGFALAMDVTLQQLEGSATRSGSLADRAVRSEVGVLVATEARQPLKSLESGPGSRCAERAGSALLHQPLRSGDAGKLCSSRPLSPCPNRVLLAEDQLPDHVNERLSLTVARNTMAAVGACGELSTGARSFLTPGPDLGGPATTPLGGKMAFVSVDTVLVSSADVVGPARTDIVATVTNVSLSGVVAPDSDDVDRARAEELQELGEVAAALAGLHQAELSRPSVPRPMPLSMPAAAVAEDRSRSRSERRPALSDGSADQEHTAASVPSSSTFQWPQPEPLLPAQEQPFALPRDWLVTRPPRYEPVKRNVWLSRGKPKRLPKDEITICACRAPPLASPGELQRMGCGPNCLNRLSSILCDPKLCPCGELCSNRSLHLLRQPKTEVFLTENRGYGVRAMEPINKGGFIIEYAGEVIDERELGRRMDHARMNGEPHFYIMELSAGLYIDARRRGNIARLINSSCDPNCETQKWHDAATGEVRVGIFATRDIMPGEELVYDYFFSTYGAGKQSAASFICMCGAKNCRGTMDLHPEKRRDLGRRVEVFWDADGQFYRAVIVAYHPTSRKHTVMYEDGGTEKLCLDEVPHRWLDDEPCPNLRISTRLEAAASVHPEAVPSVPAELLPQQVAHPEQDRIVLDRLPQPKPAEDSVGLSAGRLQPVGAIPVPAAVAQPPPRPVVSADQRCMLPPLRGSVSCPTVPAPGTMGKHSLQEGELHLPLKKRPRMMQQLSQPGQQLSEVLPASLADPGRGSGMTHPQGSTGSGGAVSAAVGDRSGGGADSGGGDVGMFARTSTRQECSGTGSGRVDDDANDDLDSLLEAAEAVAALRTAPIGNVPMSHTINDGVLPLQPRHIRSVSAGALGSGLVSMVQTAKVASPRHLAAVQRSGPPNGLPPHGGTTSGRLVGGPQPHGSSSSSGLASYHTYHHARHHPLGLPGFGHHEPQDEGHPVLPERHPLPVARSRRASGEQGDHLNNTNGYRGHLEPNSAGNREDLLWRLVGIEKPKDLLPLFASRAKLRNGGPRSGNRSWIAPSHPYGKLLRALEASELLPQADELRLLAQHQAQATPQHQYHVPHSQSHSRPLAQAQLAQVQQPVQSPTQPQTAAQPAATTAEVLAMSVWQHAAQHQAAQHLSQHGHTSAAQNVSYQTNGTDCGAANVASLLHVQQQHAAMAAAATAAAALAASKGQLLGGAHQAAESYSMQATVGTVPAASAQGQHIGQQQLAAAAAAAAAQWQHAAHMQQQHGHIIQDLVQMYVAQHAAPQQMLAMAGTTVVGGSRCT